MPTDFIARMGIDTREAERSALLFGSKLQRNIGQPLGRITGDAAEFTKSLQAAAARVSAFGAVTGTMVALGRAISGAAKSTIEVNKELTELNTFLGQSRTNVAGFGKELFNVARRTATDFKTVSEAAKEFARQGLSTEETLKRTNSALILARIAGLNFAEAVTSITTAINTFNKSALDSEKIVNKLIAVDTKFAVSSNQIAQAISRVGSSAQEAGLDLDQLIATVTAVQQITGRGGSVIGNSLKTIFTRIRRPEVLEQLQQLGVTVRDQNGALLDAQQTLKNYAATIENLSQVEKARTNELLGGVFQINQLQAIVRDLSSSYSVYERALQTSTNATDEAIKKNQQLNKSFSASFSQLSSNAKQVGATLGEDLFGPLFSSAAGFSNFLLDILSGGELSRNFEKIGQESGENFGKGLVEFATKTIGTTIGNFAVPLASTIGLALTARLGKFAFTSLKTGISDSLGFLQGARGNRERLQNENAILSVLRTSSEVRRAIGSENYDRLGTEELILREIAKQNQALVRQDQILATMPNRALFGSAARKGRSSGYIPAFAQEEMEARAMGAVNPKAMVVSGTIKGKTQPIIVNDQESVFNIGGETAVVPNYRNINDIPSFAKGTFRLNNGRIPEALQKIIIGGKGKDLLVTSQYDAFKTEMGDSDISGGLGYPLKFTNRSFAATKELPLKGLQAAYDYISSRGGKVYYAPSVPVGSIGKYGNKIGGMNMRNIFFMKNLAESGSLSKNLSEEILYNVNNPTKASLINTGRLYNLARQELLKKNNPQAVTNIMRKSADPFFDPVVLAKFKTHQTKDITKDYLSYVLSEVTANKKGSITPSRGGSKHPLYKFSALGKNPRKFNPTNIPELFEQITGRGFGGAAGDQPLPQFSPYGVLFNRSSGDLISKTLGLSKGRLPSLEDITRNSQKTQIATTIGTYKKIGAYLKQSGFGNKKVLDFGSGLGLGTKFLGKKAQSYEINPKGDYKPNFTKINQIPNESYDAIASANVFNTIPPQIRDGVLRDLGSKLKRGGKAVISVRTPGDVKSSKTKQPYLDGYLIDGAFQKGFNLTEFKKYVKSVLGTEKFKIESGKAGVSATHIELTKLAKGRIPRFAKGFRTPGGKAFSPSEEIGQTNQNLTNLFLTASFLPSIIGSIVDPLAARGTISGGSADTASILGNLALAGGGAFFGAKTGGPTRGGKITGAVLTSLFPAIQLITELSTLGSRQKQFDLEKLQKQSDTLSDQFQKTIGGFQDLTDVLGRLEAAYKDPSSTSKTLIELNKTANDLTRKLAGADAGLGAQLSAIQDPAERTALLERIGRRETRSRTIKESILELGSIDQRNISGEVFNNFFKGITREITQENFSKLNAGDIRGASNKELLNTLNELDLQDLTNFFESQGEIGKTKLLPAFKEFLATQIDIKNLTDTAIGDLNEIGKPLTDKIKSVKRQDNIRLAINEAFSKGTSTVGSSVSGFGTSAGLSFQKAASISTVQQQSTQQFLNKLLSSTGVSENLRSVLDKGPSANNTSILRDELATNNSLTQEQRDSLRQLLATNESGLAKIEDQTKIAEATFEVQRNIALGLERISGFAGGISSTIDPTSRVESINELLRPVLRARLGGLFGSRRSVIAGQAEFLSNLQKQFPGSGIGATREAEVARRNLQALRFQDISRSVSQAGGLAQSLGLGGATQGIVQSLGGRNFSNLLRDQVETFLPTGGTPFFAQRFLQRGREAFATGIEQKFEGDAEIKRLESQLSQANNVVLDSLDKNVNRLAENIKKSFESLSKLKIDTSTINVTGQANISLGGQVNRSKGFIPSFANPLRAAIARESQYVPSSSIRVNQSDRLMNSANPMGLAVTNTFDEPNGLSSLGLASGGFIPNFARRKVGKRHLSNPNQSLLPLASELPDQRGLIRIILEDLPPGDPLRLQLLRLADSSPFVNKGSNQATRIYADQLRSIYGSPGPIRIPLSATRPPSMALARMSTLFPEDFLDPASGKRYNPGGRINVPDRYRLKPPGPLSRALGSIGSRVGGGLRRGFDFISTRPDQFIDDVFASGSRRLGSLSSSIRDFAGSAMRGLGSIDYRGLASRGYSNLLTSGSNIRNILSDPMLIQSLLERGRGGVMSGINLLESLTQRGISGLGNLSSRGFNLGLRGLNASVSGIDRLTGVGADFFRGLPSRSSNFLRGGYSNLLRFGANTRSLLSDPMLMQSLLERGRGGVMSGVNLLESLTQRGISGLGNLSSRGFGLGLRGLDASVSGINRLTGSGVDFLRSLSARGAGAVSTGARGAVNMGSNLLGKILDSSGTRAAARQQALYKAIRSGNYQSPLEQYRALIGRTGSPSVSQSFRNTFAPRGGGKFGLGLNALFGIIGAKDLYSGGAQKAGGAALLTQGLGGILQNFGPTAKAGGILSGIGGSAFGVLGAGTFLNRVANAQNYQIASLSDPAGLAMDFLDDAILMATGNPLGLGVGIGRASYRVGNVLEEQLRLGERLADTGLYKSFSGVQASENRTELMQNAVNSMIASGKIRLPQERERTSKIVTKSRRVRGAQRGLVGANPEFIFLRQLRQRGYSESQANQILNFYKNGFGFRAGMQSNNFNYYSSGFIPNFAGGMVAEMMDIASSPDYSGYRNATPQMSSYYPNVVKNSAEIEVPATEVYNRMGFFGAKPKNPAEKYAILNPAQQQALGYASGFVPNFAMDEFANVIGGAMEKVLSPIADKMGSNTTSNVINVSDQRSYQTDSEKIKGIMEFLNQQFPREMGKFGFNI